MSTYFKMINLLSSRTLPGTRLSPAPGTMGLPFASYNTRNRTEETGAHEMCVRRGRKTVNSIIITKEIQWAISSIYR